MWIHKFVTQYIMNWECQLE